MDDLKARLLADRRPSEDVEIPGVGTVRVRGLSRAEVLLMQKQIGTAKNAKDVDGSRALLIERKLIAAGLVNPAMTEAEVRRWQERAGMAELEPVSDAISRLSGLEEFAVKVAHKSLPDEPGDGVPVLPGGEASDDGGRPDGAAE